MFQKLSLWCLSLLPAFVSLTGFASSQVHWTYEGEDGPAYWGTMSPEYLKCTMGKFQSPVNIITADVKDNPKLAPLDIHYENTTIHSFHNGHAIQFNVDPGSFVQIGEKKYSLVQFHFHAPGENEWDGKSFPVEVHFVHKSEAGELMVIGVWFEKGNMNYAYHDVFNSIPQKAGEKLDFPKKVIELAKLLPEEKTYYNFSGSLTTPPCAEPVNWVMLEKSLSLSQEQISNLTKVIRLNNRPVQSLKGRVIQRKK